MRLVHAIGATSSVAESENPGLSDTPAASAAFAAFAVKPLPPWTEDANASSLLVDDAGSLVKNRKSIVARLSRTLRSSTGGTRRYCRRPAISSSVTIVAVAREMTTIPVVDTHHVAA